MKKKIHPNIVAGVLALTACCLVPETVAQPTPPISGNWTLTFQDEFGGSTLNSGNWRFGQHYAGNGGEAGANTPSNITVSSGKLRLRTGHEPGYFGQEGSTNYTMSEISTFKHFRQKYGYFEARIKHTGQAGLWPAFWLMPDRGDYGYQNACWQSYLKFNLTGAGISTVSSAKLRLTVSSVQTGSGIDPNLLVMKVSDDSWTESGIKWNNAPTPDPLWIGHKYNFSASQGTVFEFDVKDYVVEEVNGNKIVSFCLADTFMKEAEVKFFSRNYSNAAYRPKLVINGTTYYPVADATIRAGDYEGTNYGSSDYLNIRDDYDDTASTYNGGMEIDIMESLGVWGAHSTSHTLHWDGYPSTNTGSGQLNYPATSDSFHTYGLYWENGLVEFYIDGIKTWQWANSRVMSVPAFIILSHQLGGWGTNNDVNPNVHNKFMEVDYVRVWSGTKTSGGGGVAGTKNIINRKSGKALRPLNGGTGDNVETTQYTPNSTALSFKWDVVSVGGGYYKIQNKYNGKALRPANSTTADNVNIIQYTYNGWNTQQWQFPSVGGGYYNILNRNSGKVMRPLNGGTANDVNIVQHYNGDPTWLAHQWQLIENP